MRCRVERRERLGGLLNFFIGRRRGDNSLCQLGNNTESSSPVPVQVPGWRAVPDDLSVTIHRRPRAALIHPPSM
jgi:hypothetical protein